MYHHHEPAGYTERQQDAFGFAGTWHKSPAALAELGKLDAAIVAYKTTGADEAWNALCDAETAIIPALDEIRAAVIFDACTDDDHGVDLDDAAPYADEVTEWYIDAFVFGEAELREAA